MVGRKCKYAKILLVEDERRYRMLIADALRMRGYDVVEACDGRSALGLAVTENFDLVLLDVRLPDMDGFGVCERLRDFVQAPIIMVTALAEDRNKIRGFDVGADDYLTKPFSVEELLARVRAALRRAWHQAREGASLQFEGLRIDSNACRVTVGEREVSLSTMEYRLLWFLAANAGRVLVPEVIAQRVWNAPYDSVRGALKTTIGRLRRKLGDNPSNPKYIHTRRGIGYLFAATARSNG